MPFQTLPSHSSRSTIAKRRLAETIGAGGCALFLLFAFSAPSIDARPDPTDKRDPLNPIPDVDESTHDPYDSEECSECHARDDVNDPGPVVKRGKEVCFSCHEDMEETFKSGPVKHNFELGSCTDCHNPHNSSRASLLRADTNALCLSCHSNKQDAGHGRTVRSIGAELKAGTHHHKPVDEKGCLECHLPHAGNQPRLLKKAYPTTFYAPYSRDAYALCFSCHDAKMIEERQTTSATGFRDGDKNLHSVHVDRAQKGRTCSACHGTHAAPGAHQLADAVPFGTHGWKLKANYKQTPTGGSCAKTCHDQRTYRRRADAPPPMNKTGDH